MCEQTTGRSYILEQKLQQTCRFNLTLSAMNDRPFPKHLHAAETLCFPWHTSHVGDMVTKTKAVL